LVLHQVLSKFYLSLTSNFSNSANIKILSYLKINWLQSLKPFFYQAVKQLSKDMQTSQATSPNTNLPATNSKALLWSLAIIRVIGYILLVFSFFEFIDTVIPPRFTNPGWEFQTVGRLVESTPIILLGFGLIYAGREIGRNPKERLILPILPWLALIIGVFYLLTVPLSILNTTRLLRINNQQLVQIEEQKTRVNEVKTNLEKTKTQADLEKLLKDLGNQNPVPQLESAQLEEIKTNLGNIVQGGENQLNTQVQQLKSARFDLQKKSVKWSLGGLLSGVLFLYIWRVMRRRA
jgi:hypothetical protein